MTLRRSGFSYPAVLLSFIFSGCDHKQPLAPSLEAASTVGSGSTLSAPSNTGALAVSANRVDVAWQDNSTNESGFEVHRSTTGKNGAFSLLVSAAKNVTSYSDQALDPSKEYCYQVRAFRRTGSTTSYSVFSATACATTPAPPPSTAPAAPDNAGAFPEGSTAVGVSWRDNSTIEDGFRVERSLDAGTTWATAGATGPDALWLVDGGRTSEQPVCYRVIAFNVKGDSPPSNEDCTSPPAGPTDLTATAVDSATAELTWTDNSAVEDGYEVVRCIDSCSTYASLPANSTVYVVTCGGYASFFVVATKDGGESDSSNAIHPVCLGDTWTSATTRP